MHRRRWPYPIALALAALCLTAPGAGAAAPDAMGDWTFDEGAGQSVLDAGPNALHGVLGESDAIADDDPARIAGLSGGALRFNGTSAVRLPDTGALSTPTVTAESVLRSESPPGPWRYVISRGSRDCLAGAYGLYTGAAGGIAFYVFDGTGFVVSATARPEDIWDGRWHHVAGTFDGSAVRLFLDGQPVGAPIATPLQIDYAGTTTRTVFGRYAGACDLGFRGDVDRVRLSSRALAPETIAAAATATVGAAALPFNPAQAGTLLPGAPSASGPQQSAAPSCRLRVSRLRVISPGATLRVRVMRRGKPLRSVRVIAQSSGRLRVLGSARTNRAGNAQLRVRVRPSVRLRISAAGRKSCAPAYVRVKPRS